MVTNATTDPPLQHSNKEHQKKKKQQISRRYRFEIYLRNILSNDIETFDQSELTMTNFINQR